MALILDGGDGTSGNPVDGVSVGGLVELNDSLGNLSVGDITENALVFSLAPVRELVVTSTVAGRGGVVLLDELINKLEVVEAGVEHINIVVLLVELSHIVDVVELNGGDGGGGTDKGGESEGFHV